MHGIGNIFKKGLASTRLYGVTFWDTAMLWVLFGIGWLIIQSVLVTDDIETMLTLSVKKKQPGKCNYPTPVCLFIT